MWIFQHSLFIFQKANKACSDNNNKTPLPLLQGPSKCCGEKVDWWISNSFQYFTPKALHFLLVTLKSSQEMPHVELEELQCWQEEQAFYSTRWPPPAPFLPSFSKDNLWASSEGATLLYSGLDCSFTLSAHTMYPERTNISSELFIVYGNDNNIEICYDLINYEYVIR